MSGTASGARRRTLILRRVFVVGDPFILTVDKPPGR
jgi:hypothetical protein